MTTKKANGFLAVINIYQIIIYLICLSTFVLQAIENLERKMNLIFAFTYILLIVLSAYSIYLNAILLFRKNKPRSFISLVAWLNFLQIFYFSIMGLTYFLFLGPVIMPYFNYTDSMSLGVHFDLLNSNFSLYYKENDKIAIGINLIPMVIFILLSWIHKSVLMEEYVRQIE